MKSLEEIAFLRCSIEAMWKVDGRGPRWWDSMDAIKGFAGDKPEVARYCPDDDRFLLDRPMSTTTECS